jgi:hypothetical protein
MHDGPFRFPLSGVLRLGALLALTDEGRPLVEGPGGPEEALSLVPLGRAEVGRTVALGRLEDGTPLVLGLLRPPVPPDAPQAPGTPAVTVSADAGGARLIEAAERLELRCGAASLTLHADGRVEIRGTQILSRAEGANRIQGATVHLN